VSGPLARRFEVVVLVVALAALALIVQQVGVANLAHDYALVGIWFVPILLLEVGQHVLNTLGLLACFPRDRRSIGFVRGALVRLAGETVNMTTPTATVGGEVIKVTLLSRHAPAERVAASISLAYASQMLAQMMFVLMALPLAVPCLTLPTGAVWFLAVCVVGGTVFSAFFTEAMRAGPYSFLHRGLRRLGLAKEGSKTDHATREVDAHSRELAQDLWAFRSSVVWFLLGWAWGIAEVVLISWALGNPLSWWEALTIESLATFWDALMFFVPAQIGTREAGLGGIVAAIGHPARLGFELSLVRRGRQIAWALIGLFALAALRRWDAPAEPAAAPEPVGATEPAAPEPEPAAPPPSEVPL
jgi:hypothetical protein